MPDPAPSQRPGDAGSLGYPADVYDVPIDPRDLNTSHAQTIDLVGSDKTVLDVGCWRGDLGRILMDRGCTVYGLERDPAAAAHARTLLAEVAEGDLNEIDLTEVFAGRRFDVVIFADVLEHILDPDKTLAEATRLLAPGGRVVISIPNVAHASLRLAHLQGSWELADVGLLDRTHIKFFTKQSLVEMVEGSGLSIVDFRGITRDALGTLMHVDRRRLPIGALWWVRAQREAYVFQFQLAAELRAEQQAAAPLRLPTRHRDNVRSAIRDDLRRVKHAWTSNRRSLG